MSNRRRWKPHELQADFKKQSPLKKIGWAIAVLVPLAGGLWSLCEEEPATKEDLAIESETILEEIEGIKELLSDTELRMRGELRARYPIGYALLWSDGQRTVRDTQGSTKIDWSYAKIGDVNATEGIEVILPRLQVRTGGMTVVPYRMFLPRPPQDGEFGFVALGLTEIQIQVLEYRAPAILFVIGIVRADGLSPKTEWIEGALRERP